METAIVFVAAILASFYGTSVGGAGLILVPLLIFLDVPPQEAVATTIFGYLGMMAIGFIEFHRAKKIDYSIGIPGAILTGAGGIIGAHILLELPNDFLQKLIGWFILVMLILLIIDKNRGLRTVSVGPRRRQLGFFMLFLLGILSGFIAGGIAILGSYILLYFFGQTFLESAGTRKPIFLIRTTVIVSIYAFHGLIDWRIGLTMLVAEVIGAYIGTHYALKKGSGWVRYLFMVVVLFAAVKLLLP